MAEKNFFLKASEDSDEIIELDNMCKQSFLFQNVYTLILFKSLIPIAVWQRKKLFEEHQVSAEDVLGFNKVMQLRAYFLVKKKKLM